MVSVEGPVFDLACASHNVSAPFFALFEKGGRDADLLCDSLRRRQRKK
jgi:hypothetical protein